MDLKFFDKFLEGEPNRFDLEDAIDDIIDFGEEACNLINTLYAMGKGRLHRSEVTDECNEFLDNFVKESGISTYDGLYEYFDMLHNDGHDVYNKLVKYREEHFSVPEEEGSSLVHEEFLEDGTQLLFMSA